MGKEVEAGEGNIFEEIGSRGIVGCLSVGLRGQEEGDKEDMESSKRGEFGEEVHRREEGTSKMIIDGREEMLRRRNTRTHSYQIIDGVELRDIIIIVHSIVEEITYSFHSASLINQFIPTSLQLWEVSIPSIELK